MRTPPPLLLTRDQQLVAEVLRLAAAAGVALDVVDAPDRGLRGWLHAPTVLVGADAAEAVAAAAPPRREDVHLLCPAGAAAETYRAAVALGASSVVELPAADGWLVELLADVGEGRPGRGAVVAVTSGSGGAGGSVLAAALAVTAARRGATAALVDLDPWGPGAQTLLGFDDLPGVTWADLTDSHGRLGTAALREALPGRDGVGVLGWPPGPVADSAVDPPAGLVREVVGAAARGHDWVFLDVPRSGVASADELLLRCDHVLVVARAALGSVSATARLAERLTAGPALAAVVVRARRGGPLPEEVARAVGLPLAAELPEQRRLDEHLDLGVGPVHSRRAPLARVAERLLDELAER